MMDANHPAAVRFKDAVHAGDAGEVRRLFDEHPELKEAIDEPWFSFGMPAVVCAAMAGRRDLIDALLDLGADINAKSQWENGPYGVLDTIVDKPAPVHVALADHLISRGARLDIHAAAGLGRIQELTALLDASPDRVSEPGPDGATPLHLAMNVGIAKLLLDRGAEIDKRCVDHQSTPAMWSVSGREAVTRFLVERGATADLFMAAVLDDVPLAERILDADPDAIEVSVGFRQSHPHVGYGNKYIWALDFAQTPVEVARRRGHEAVYRFLLSRSSPAVNLVQAARRGDLSRLTDLLDRHPDLLPSLTGNQTVAALSGTVEVVHLLLDRGAEVNALDEDHGATALHWGAWHGDADRVKVLLDHGANTTIRDRMYSGTPAGWAHVNGHPEVEALLVQAR